MSSENICLSVDLFDTPSTDRGRREMLWLLSRDVELDLQRA